MVGAADVVSRVDEITLELEEETELLLLDVLVLEELVLVLVLDVLVFVLALDVLDLTLVLDVLVLEDVFVEELVVFELVFTVEEEDIRR